MHRECVESSKALLAVKLGLCVTATLLLSTGSQARAGVLYVSAGNSEVYRYSPDGSRSTFATGINAGGIAFDATGNLFVAGPNTNSIYKITPAGIQSTLTFATGLNQPTGLAFDANGNLFVSNFANSFIGGGYILKFSPSGVRTVFATGLSGASGLAFDRNGNLFEADSVSSGAIHEFTPAGIRSTFATGLIDPGGLAFDAAGNIYDSDNGHNISKLAPDGSKQIFASGLSGPLGLAFDENGNLFEADFGGRSIFEFTPDGVRVTFATFAMLDTPSWLAFAPAVVPEPATFFLVAIASASASLMRPRKKKSQGSRAKRAATLG